MDDNVKLSHNTSEDRYELHLGDELIGQIDYTLDGEVQDMHHTEVKPEHGGKGLGERLVEYALSDAREHRRQVIPTCPFIARFIDKNPDFEDLKHADDGPDFRGFGVGGTMGTSDRPS